MKPIRPQIINPFTLPPVLEVLFKHCDIETLKASRLVCKLWLSTSIQSFYQATLINFYSMRPQIYAEMMGAIKGGLQIEPTNVALTLSPLYGEAIFFERHLTVCPWSACDDFIFPFGESIRSLKFYAWDQVSERLNGPLLSHILLTPSHLVSLEISLLPDSVTFNSLFPLPWNREPPLIHLTNLVMYGRIDCSREFMHNFLGAMPNVRSITVDCCSTDFLDIFCPTFHEIPLKKVEHLKLNFVSVFNKTHIFHIEQGNLPLKTLHLAQRSHITSFDEYTKLLRRLARTLEELKLTCCTTIVSKEHFLNLPHMPKLKTLRVQSWLSGYAIWNLNFINYLPNLESLVLERRGLGACYIPGHYSDPDLDIQCFLRVESLNPHMKLKSLVIPIMPMIFPKPETLATLLPKFENLVKLTLSANDSCLLSVFQNAAQLQELIITEYSKITDGGITGLVFNPEGTGPGRSGDDHETPRDFNINLGITALKDLRRLELDGFGGNITDYSVKHGLAHLSKLESVIFRCCRITDIGIETLSKMQITIVGHETVHMYAPEPQDDILVLAHE